MPDIVKFYLSGGASNSNPNLSLGGVMSSVEIDFSNPQDNLFDDVLSDDALNGYIDYRCFYIMNVTTGVDSVTVHNLVVEIDSEVSGGSSIVLGDDLLNDEQLLTISGTPDIAANPNVLFNVPGWGVPFQADYGTTGDPFDDISTFAANIEAQMNAQPVFVGVTVTFVDNTTVLVTFSGFPANHFMPLIDIISAALGGGATINVTKQQDGGPVMVTSETIPNERVTPSVTLGVTSLSIGELQADEYFPVWVKRTTPPNSAALLNDNFVLSLQGDYP